MGEVKIPEKVLENLRSQLNKNNHSKIMEEGWTLWFTGMHGAGKSTIAQRLVKILRDKKIPVVLLDGDDIRKTVSADLGYSIEDRNEHMKRVANLCYLITKNGVSVISCVASPTEKSRAYARKMLKNLFLVYVKCPLKICEERDIKGHYKKARNKEKGFENFLGVSLEYEGPKNPDIILNTGKESVEESVDKLLTYLKENKIIK